MADEFGEKTEQPTEHRRQEARQEGNVARSVDLTSAGHMLAATGCIAFLGLPLARGLSGLMRQYLGGEWLHHRDWARIDAHWMLAQAAVLAEYLQNSFLPVLLILLAAAVAINLAQTGVLISPQALQLKLSRLNPLSGLQRIFSIASAVKLAISLSKVAVLAAVAYWTIQGLLPAFLNMPADEPSLVLLQIHSSVTQLAVRLSVAFLLLAVLDYGFQKWKYEQDLLMTKQELRDEMKQMEGDPQMRARRRDAHRRLAEAQSMEEVRHADVLLANPTHVSVAIRFDPKTMPAPRITAKGLDGVALRMREVARSVGVPVIERPELARMLYRELKVGEFIPVDLYEVFIELMAYVYDITGRRPDGLD
ncbi:MAG: EscU/YscU/HrcU family type III secretion system export apparatus switch protein [Planctomycetaceae bacterium]|nr:EscU/YscU/HrcU family type III secretion system export apparatus switch protein [Planctomycetaceae bacterium]